MAFALETSNGKKNALKKLKDKGADVIVLNHPSEDGCGIDSNFNKVSILSINNENGTTNWSVFLGSDYNSVYTSARPIVAQNKIIVPGTGGAFFILSGDKGQVLWNENISSNKQLPKIFHSGDIIANPIEYEDPAMTSMPEPAKPI